MSLIPEQAVLTVKVLRPFYRGRDIVPAGSIVTLPRSAATELISSNKARLLAPNEAKPVTPSDNLVRVPQPPAKAAALTTDKAAPLIRRK